MCEAGIQPERWHQQAETIWPDDAEKMGPRGLKHLLPQLGALIAGEPGRYDDSALGAALA
jgi:hypothetical protein